MREKLRINMPKRYRITAACDACRSRKVKCVYPDGALTCSGCKEHNLECTNIEPRKKRGPKNRYVHELRAQLDGNAGTNLDDNDHGTDLIAPQSVLDQIIADWFGWIHPIAPILHPTIFMQHLHGTATQERDRSISFLLLAASISAATYASLRRRRHLYGSLSVASCIELCDRFALWESSSQITLERALTMYNLSTAAMHEFGLDAPLTHRLVGESTACVKFLLSQRLAQMPFMDQQILRRLYWLIYAGQCTADIYGRPFLVLRHAHEKTAALFPMELSDDDLLEGAVSPSVSDQCYIPGLIALSRLFLVWQSSQSCTGFTLDHLHAHIQRTQEILSDLPQELVFSKGAILLGDFGHNVQKANLKVTQLHIRSNLLEQMNVLAKDQGFQATPHTIIEERHLVVEELLDVLYAMPEDVFDANGYSILPKIRDIGSALFDELRTGSQGRTLQASISLDKLLAKLQHLDLEPLVTTPRHSMAHDNDYSRQ